MRRELPPGTVKIKVIDFVREMHPFRWEDQGKKLTAHWLEETGDLVRSWDIVVIFEFDEAGHLLHYSQTETDFIDYDFRALTRK